MCLNIIPNVPNRLQNCYPLFIISFLASECTPNSMGGDSNDHNCQRILSNPWNYLDIIRDLTSVAWIILWVCELSSLYFTWLVTLITPLRGITAFGFFDGTRFYIKLIFRVLNDIKYLSSSSHIQIIYLGSCS